MTAIDDAGMPIAVADSGPQGVRVDCDVIGCSGFHHPNLPLLGKVMEAVMHNPRSWYQGDWARVPESVVITNPDGSLEFAYSEGCGAAFCAAGWTAQIKGVGLDLMDFGDGWYNASRTVLRDKTGMQLSVREYAQHELGLTIAEAQLLFDGNNTLPVMLEQCARIAERADHEWQEHMHVDVSMGSLEPDQM